VSTSVLYVVLLVCVAVGYRALTHTPTHLRMCVVHQVDMCTYISVCCSVLQWAVGL